MGICFNLWHKKMKQGQDSSLYPHRKSVGIQVKTIKVENIIALHQENMSAKCIPP